MNPKTAIVAHDAGAANHIIAWLKTGLLDTTTSNFCLDGPAASICRKNFTDFDNLPLEAALKDVSLLISGTGWASALEHDARALASTQPIKTVAVLDHWTNYRTRFNRQDIEVLPDEVWVVDDYAYDIAQKILPDIKIVLQRNDYIALQKQEIEAFGQTVSSTTRVLFLMEPIRQPWNNNPCPGELQALDFFVNRIDDLQLGNNIKIIIKPHPSDPAGKYEKPVQSHAGHNIEIDYHTSLAELLAWSDVVTGCQTYAMAVALAAGKKVISALPPDAPPCLLPHKDILHLSKLVTQNAIL